jgi:hypothetical protein
VNNWFGIFGAPVATPATSVPATTAGGIVSASTPMPTTIAATTTQASTPSASVSLIGAVSKTSNNALKGTFSINGVSQSISVIPGGDAYNDSGQGITAQLAAQGVTPAQLYAMLSAAYTPAAPAASVSASTSNNIGSLPLVGAVSKTVNNALKATVMFLGSPMSVSIIPNAWTVWNDAGQQVTSQFTNAGVNIQALYNQMAAAVPGGMGAYRPMVFANRGNYVLARSRYR